MQPFEVLSNNQHHIVYPHLLFSVTVCTDVGFILQCCILEFSPTNLITNITRSSIIQSIIHYFKSFTDINVPHCISGAVADCWVNFFVRNEHEQKIKLLLQKIMYTIHSVHLTFFKGGCK